MLLSLTLVPQQCLLMIWRLVLHFGGALSDLLIASRQVGVTQRSTGLLLLDSLFYLEFVSRDHELEPGKHGSKHVLGWVIHHVFLDFRRDEKLTGLARILHGHYAAVLL